MSNFIISPYAISWDSIKNNLQNYVFDKDKDQAWKDFYSTSAGETVIELIAALGTFYAYQFIVGRRESFLSFAQNYSSALGLAQNLGYSASRGHNLKVKLNIIPNTNPEHIFKKWDVIGKYGEYSVVVAKETKIETDDKGNIKPLDIEVFIGNLISVEYSINSTALQQFTFTNSDATDDCTLTLNDVEVPISTNIAEALNDKYIMLTNALGSVDVFYLNDSENAQYRYKNGDILKFYYIERNKITSSEFSNSKLEITLAKQINETKTISDRIEKEDINNIKVKAPIYHETACAIRSRKDYSKFLLIKGQNLLGYDESSENYRTIIDANDKDIYPGLIELTYIKDDGSTMTVEEKEYWLNQIEEARPSGVARATISDPIYINKRLNIKIWRTKDTDLLENTGSNIQKILDKYANKLGIEIDLDQIEHDIEQLQGVKIARVNVYAEERQPNYYYSLFDIIETPKGNFYFDNFIYTTSETEPEWGTQFGDIVIDKDIIWEKVNKFEATVIDTWSANTKFNKYDYIKVTKDEQTHIYVCKGYAVRTSAIEPTWNEDTIYDGAIIWKKQTKDENITLNWSANTIVNLGDKITTDNGTYMCIEFRGLTSEETIDWNEVQNEVVTDGNIQWKLIDTYERKINLDWNQYIKLDMDYVITG